MSINPVKWKSIRSLPWKTLYSPLLAYLIDGTIPEKSPSSLARFKRLAKKFELNEDGRLVLITNTPLDTDENGENLMEDTPTRSYLVQNPEEKESLILSFFHNVFSGGYKGIESMYKKITAQYIGITRQDISDVLKRIELKQLKRPTLTRDLKPILTSKPMEFWQIDLVDFTKLGYERHNDSFVFIM
jgi:hypothetical protein